MTFTYASVASEGFSSLGQFLRKTRLKGYFQEIIFARDDKSNFVFIVRSNTNYLVKQKNLLFYEQGAKYY